MGRFYWEIILPRNVGLSALLTIKPIPKLLRGWKEKKEEEMESLELSFSGKDSLGLLSFYDFIKLTYKRLSIHSFM